MDSDDAAELGIFRGSRSNESGLPPYGSRSIESGLPLGRIEFVRAASAPPPPRPLVDYRTWSRAGVLATIIFGPGGRMTYVNERGARDLEKRPLSDSDDDPRIMKPSWGGGSDAITICPTAGLLFTGLVEEDVEMADDGDVEMADDGAEGADGDDGIGRWF